MKTKTVLDVRLPWMEEYKAMTGGLQLTSRVSLSTRWRLVMLAPICVARAIVSIRKFALMSPVSKPLNILLPMPSKLIDYVISCIYVFVLVHYRQDAANCRYCFYSQAKNQVFRPTGATRCTDCRTGGHLGPLGCAEFHVNRCRRVGMRPPKYQKFPLFGQGRLP